MTRLFLSSGDASEFTLFLIGEAVVALVLIAYRLRAGEGLMGKPDANGTVLEALSSAADRGVHVTIITNFHDAPTLRFKWRLEEKWWGAVGTFAAAGFEAKVFDKDGDASEWVLKRGKTVIAEGGDHGWKPFYHFDACLLAAEAALLTAARERVASIKGVA